MMTRKMMCKQGWRIVGIVVAIAGMLEAWHPVMALEQVNFLLDWTISNHHAPFFLAVEKGYFEEENIEVIFIEGQGSPTTVKVISNDKDYPIGLINYATMAKGIARGLTLKAVFGILQTSPMGITSRADAPINHPKELEGKIAAMVAGSGVAQNFPALLRRNHVDENAVTFLQTHFGAYRTLFLDKRCDVLVGFVNDDPMYLEQQGIEVYSFRYADFGVNLLGMGITVNTTYLEEYGDVVAGMVRAISKGWQNAQEDPEAAVDALLKYYPDHAEKRDLYLAQLEATLLLLETPNTQGKPLGWMSEKDWEQTQELLFEYGGLEQKLPLETYYTNDYIPTAE